MKKILYTVIFTLILNGTMNAQADTSLSDNKIPTLNGHTFVSSSYPKNSFVTTSLRADIGFGMTSSVTIPGITVGDYQLLAFEGNILYINLNVQYQQRFTPWLALFLTMKMAGRVGTDMSTIMVDGVNTLTGSSVGWLLRIRNTKKFNLSGTIQVNKMTGNFINVSEYFEEIINNAPNPSVTKQVPALSVGVGARGAYAFSPTYGLQFQLDYAYGESLERTKTQGYFSGGVLGDVNFLPKHNVPIGLALGYSLSSAPEIVMDNGGYSSLFLGKIGYTGSKDFELGLQYSFYNVNLRSIDDKASISKITLMLKFYF